MDPRPGYRHGLTSVDLLTITAVGVVLASLIVPSLLLARQAARSNRCTNNLKQIGAGLHVYHQVFKSFPAGWLATTSEADSQPWYGWQARLLPYVRQAPLHNQIEFRNPAPPAVHPLTRRVEVYICPDNLDGVINDIRGGYGVSFYSGNHGDERLPGSADTPRTANGIFYWNSTIAFRDIPDGSADTFMVGERSIASAAGIWMGVRANRHENDAVTDCSDHARINGDISSFSSIHGPGANFLFCDGAVRFISEAVDSRPPETGPMGIYQRLSVRNDGLRVALD